MRNKFYKHKIENLILIPKIVTIHYLELDKDFVFGGEKHDFWELVYADKESVICTAEGEEFILSQGELAFHKPNEFHTIRADKKQAPNVFVITFECKSEAIRYFENKRLALPPELKIHIHDIIKEAGQTFGMKKQNPNLRKMELQKSPALGGQQLIRLNLEQLLIKLSRLENKKTDSEIFINRDIFENNLLNEIVGFLKNNVFGSLSLADVCKKTNYCKSYLYAFFKSQTGCGIMNYYVRLKIDAAKKLIRENKYSFGEISERLCFSDLSYFGKAFKKLTGMTAAQYRKSIKC